MADFERRNTIADKFERRRVWIEEFIKEHNTPASALEAVMEEGLTPRRRALAFANLAMNLVPGSRQLILNAFGGSYDHTKTPINPEIFDIEGPEASGYWSQMFLLRSKRQDIPNMAYKVGFPASRQPAAYYEELANRYRSEYLSFKKTYADAGYPDIVPDTQYLIVESPRKHPGQKEESKPAVAMLQTYFGTNAFDLMNPEKDNNRERLRGALKDPRFRAEFIAFRDVTLKLIEEGRGPDIIGGNNVFVVETEKGYELRFIDPHELMPRELRDASINAGLASAVAALRSIEA